MTLAEELQDIADRGFTGRGVSQVMADAIAALAKAEAAPKLSPLIMGLVAAVHQEQRTH